MAKVAPCDLSAGTKKWRDQPNKETRAAQAHSQSLITATKKRALPPRDRPHKAARSPTNFVWLSYKVGGGERPLPERAVAAALQPSRSLLLRTPRPEASWAAVPCPATPA